MDILPIIKDFGFPVFCVIALGWYIRSLNSEHKAERKELVESIVKMGGEVKEEVKAHKAEYKALAEESQKVQREGHAVQDRVADAITKMDQTISKVQCAQPGWNGQERRRTEG